MPSLKSVFGADNRAETEGVWLDYGKIRVRVARASSDSNPRYAKALDTVMKPVRRQIAAGIILVNSKDYRELVARAFSESIVTAWENVTDEDGVTPLPCTPENVYRMLVAYPDFYAEVDRFASSFSPFRAEVERKEDSGN